MCFVVNADWTARVVEEEELVSDGRARCDDCFRRIALGERYDRIDQQEYEECQRCEDTWSRMTDEDVAGQMEWCEQEGHDYGETFTHRMCGHCKAFRAAISAVEVREGCRMHESQPAYGDIRESIWDSDHLEEYAEVAVAMDAGLAMSGYLDRIVTRGRQHLMEELEVWEWTPAEWDVGGES